MSFKEIKNNGIRLPEGGIPSEVETKETLTGFKSPAIAKVTEAPVEQPGNQNGKSLTGIPGHDVIGTTLNVGIAHINWFLKQFANIAIPFEVELRSIDPNSIVTNAREEEKEEIEGLMKKIVAYSNDGTYTSVVPAIIVHSNYLKDAYTDPNISILNSGITKPTTSPIKSDYTLEYIVEQNTNVSEVYLKTADIIAKVACLLANIKYSELVGGTPKYGFEFAFNGKDAYTVTFNNKVYTATK